MALAVAAVSLAPCWPRSAIGSASAALGAAGGATLTRAALGRASPGRGWSPAPPLLGLGPGLDLVGAAPPDDLALALLRPESLAGAGVFALAAVVLGWILRARHLAFALLGAMVWAAGVDAALSLVGDGVLGADPVGVVVAALDRGRDRVRPGALRTAPRRPRDRPPGTAFRKACLSGDRRRLSPLDSLRFPWPNHGYSRAVPRARERRNHQRPTQP